MSLVPEELRHRVQYTGDFSFWIGEFPRRKNPDFVVKETRKAIELFGEFYHEREEEGLLKDFYERHGWEVLILWVKDLRQKAIITERLRQFISNQ